MVASWILDYSLVSMVACATILNAMCSNGTRVLINIYVWYMYIMVQH